MSSKNNKKKDQLLGMPHGTANGRLRKSIIFWLAGLNNMLTCHRCTLQIESVEDFSVEHKIPWQSAPEPKDLFFNLENITFSHLKCNIIAVNRARKYDDPREYLKVRDRKRYGSPTRQDAMRKYRRDYYYRTR